MKLDEKMETKEKFLEISKRKYGRYGGYTVKERGLLNGVIVYYGKWKRHVFHPFLIHGSKAKELEELIEFLSSLDKTRVNDTSSSKYVEFQEWFQTDPKGKWYVVLSKKDEDKQGHSVPDEDRELGYIIPNDDGYYFRSEAEDAVYDAQCLKDISNFMSKVGRP